MSKFSEGQSGNPSGRPCGIKDKRTLFAEMLDGHKQSLFDKALELALSGDPQMLRLLLDRLLPVRPKDDPLPAEMVGFSGSLVEQGKKVLDLIAQGVITPVQGNELLSALAIHAKLVETDELAERIKLLEEFAHEQKPNS